MRAHSGAPATLSLVPAAAGGPCVVLRRGDAVVVSSRANGAEYYGSIAALDHYEVGSE